MDEFIVIKVMNEAMLRLKKNNNENYSVNEKIKEILKDKNIFLKIDKDKALNILSNVGVAEDKLDDTYYKLTKKNSNC